MFDPNTKYSYPSILSPELLDDPKKIEVYYCDDPKKIERESIKLFVRQNKAELKAIKEKDPKKIAVIAFNKYLDKYPYLPFDKK